MSCVIECYVALGFKSVMSRQIHKSCCKKCPSNNDRKNGVVDPETSEIATYSKETIARHYLFSCFMRTDKLCKGICDYYGIDGEYVNQVDSDKLHKDISSTVLSVLSRSKKIDDWTGREILSLVGEISDEVINVINPKPILLDNRTLFLLCDLALENK